MATLITDSDLEERLRAEREERGLDHHDEVWEGIYFMPPIANDDHQFLSTRLAAILEIVIGMRNLGQVRAGVNVSDRDVDWVCNYRVPDVAVFLNGTSAVNRNTHWVGGPDFAIEILSENDRSRAKLDFYASVGIRELLLVDRDPWCLELYRLQNGRLNEVGRLESPASPPLVSEVVPLTFRMIPGGARPQIEVWSRDLNQTWLV